MPPRRLDNWIDSYVNYTRYEESPEQFHRWTALAMLSAAVNRNCWMDRGYYRVFPNLYILFIGPSGIGKSSASGIGVSMLKETPLLVHTFKDFITTAGLIEFMQKATVSTEVQGVLIHKTPVLIYASEIGTMINTRSGGISEFTLMLTELFNKQGNHEDRTGKRGKVIIRNPNVTFFGCCFPEWLDEALSSISLRSGFLGRMLVVSGYAKRHLKPNISFSNADILLEKELKMDLETIGNLYGEMKWTANGQRAWDDWYNKLPLDFADVADESIEVKGFTARKAQFVQRLAMLSSLSRTDSLEVTENDFLFGRKLVKECEKNTKNLKTKPVHVQVSDRLVRIILRIRDQSNSDTITIREISRRLYRVLTNQEIELGINQLCSIGFCELQGRKINVINAEIGKTD